MSKPKARRGQVVPVIVAVACSALLAVAAPPATAAPTTTTPTTTTPTTTTDDRGFVDSTARCATANDTVVFGSTDSSRVAICKTSGGQFEYRGVRLRDGAKLIVSASRADDGKFNADSDGITYTVGPKSLVVSAGNQVIREEPMVDFHGPAAAPAPAAPPATAKASPASTTARPTPLPPPLPAEVGGSGASSR